MADESSNVTPLIEQAAQGRLSAQDQLFLLVYGELHQIAHAKRHGWRPNHSLESGELVNEAFLKLVANDAKAIKKNRAYFFASAARAMRQVLIDYDRKRKPTIPFTNDIPCPSATSGSRLLALDKALSELRRHDPALADIVEYRIFAGLTIKESAKLCGVSTSTVEKRFRTARAFLRLKIEEHEHNDD